jgi:hypothetical protein
MKEKIITLNTTRTVKKYIALVNSREPISRSRANNKGNMKKAMY